MDATLAKEVDEATAASLSISSIPRANDSLPKVMIAPEASVPKAPEEEEAADANELMELSARDVISAPMELSARDVIAEGPIAEPEQVAEEIMPAKAEVEERRPSRHPSWNADGARPEPRPRKPAPVEDGRVKPQPIAAVGPARIEASPIMGIEPGKATAASGKQGISVYPPPDPAVPPEPSPGGAMRHGSVPPKESASASGSGHPSRRATQTLGTPLGISPSTAPGFGWTPPPAFGAHQMPPRESDPPPGFASIPPPPRSPSQVGPITPHVGTLTTSRHAPAVQSLPITPARVSAVQTPAAVAAEPSTVLAIARPHVARTRSEPPAASSVVCDVPKGWSPLPTLRAV